MLAMTKSNRNSLTLIVVVQIGTKSIENNGDCLVKLNTYMSYYLVILLLHIQEKETVLHTCN